MSGFGSGYNMPPGCYEWMIPGNRPQDAAWETFCESIPTECPECGQSTEGDPKDWKNHGFAPHVRIYEDACQPSATCEWENDDGEPCEADLSTMPRCRCPECDPPEREW